MELFARILEMPVSHDGSNSKDRYIYMIEEEEMIH